MFPSPGGITIPTTSTSDSRQCYRGLEEDFRSAFFKKAVHVAECQCLLLSVNYDTMCDLEKGNAVIRLAKLHLKNDL